MKYHEINRLILLLSLLSLLLLLLLLLLLFNALSRHSAGPLKREGEGAISFEREQARKGVLKTERYKTNQEAKDQRSSFRIRRTQGR